MHRLLNRKKGWSEHNATDAELQDNLRNNQLGLVVKDLDLPWWRRAVDVGPSLGELITERQDHLSNNH